MLIHKICPQCKTEFETCEGPRGNTTCSRSCSNSYFHAQRYSLASNAKRSETLTGIVRTKKETNSLLWSTKPCVICRKDFTRRRYIAKTQQTCGANTCTRKIKSLSLKGKTGGPRTGGGWGKQTEYGGVVWDSTWEARLAQRLDSLNVDWVRPGKELSIPYVTIDGETRNYYPDFYLPRTDVFVEVKGFWTEAARHRVAEGSLQKRIIVIESISAIDSFTGA